MKTLRVTAAMLACVLLAPSAFAELRHVEIKTLGMDWEICAHAVRVAMQKIDGVETVKVTLNEGMTIVDLKPGNAVTLAQLRQAIRNNGFVSKEVHVAAIGAPTSGDGKAAFDVSGTREHLMTSTPPERSGDVWKFTVPAPDVSRR